MRTETESATITQEPSVEECTETATAEIMWMRTETESAIITPANQEDVETVLAADAGDNKGMDYAKRAGGKQSH